MSCFCISIKKKKKNIYRRCFFEYNTQDARHRNAIIVVFGADYIAYNTYKMLCRKADGTETRRNQSCLCYCYIIWPQRWLSKG